MPLLVVGTYRHTEVDDRHPLADVLGEPGRVPNVTRVVLAGLDEDGGPRLRAGRRRRRHGDARAWPASVHAGTAGNPLFMREMVRHLDESGRPGDPVAGSRRARQRARTWSAAASTAVGHHQPAAGRWRR